jgi:hypothetical protein
MGLAQSSIERSGSSEEDMEHCTEESASRAIINNESNAREGNSGTGVDQASGTGDIDTRSMSSTEDRSERDSERDSEDSESSDEGASDGCSEDDGEDDSEDDESSDDDESSSDDDESSANEEDSDEAGSDEDRSEEFIARLKDVDDTMALALQSTFAQLGERGIHCLASFRCCEDCGMNALQETDGNFAFFTISTGEDLMGGFPLCELHYRLDDNAKSKVSDWANCNSNLAFWRSDEATPTICISPYAAVLFRVKRAVELAFSG